MPAQTIKISGARQHNLKNLTVEIPRERLVVITGMSGSGKSSLAFDTLYAEGQRRYVESLSAYARQFLDQMQKPDVDFIEGLSPAIAIEQRSSGANPRSTIATTTEIYDYLRLLFASVGEPHDPATGEPVGKQSPQQIVDQILANPEGTRLILLAPLVAGEKGEFRDVLEKVKREGFVRARVDGKMVDLNTPPSEQPLRLARDAEHTIEVVVDRLVVREGIRARLADSVETSLKWGQNQLRLLSQPSSAPSEQWDEAIFSTNFCNPRTGFTMIPPTPKHFSFNSHLGACPDCHGLGTRQVIDPDLLISDPAKSLDGGAITAWSKGTKRMLAYYRTLQSALVEHFKVPTDRPWARLPEHFREAVLFGTGDRAIPMKMNANGKSVNRAFEGVVPQMERLYETTESEFTKNRLRGFMSRRPCPTCGGARLKPEILAVTVRSKDAALNIHTFCQQTIDEAVKFVEELHLTPQQVTITEEVVREIHNRLGFLREVGLGYLSLNRESGTLSGGEAQRIRLATQIGSGLAGVLYVLDEPSIGLHQRDNERLLGTLRRLRDLGNSVIVVEHDEDTIRAADYILDLGPGAGPRGGYLVAEGTFAELVKHETSLTAAFLSGRQRIAIPKERFRPREDLLADARHSVGWLTVTGAQENNLKNINAAFPLGLFTCVTGVSGSGKSTLVDDILRRALFRQFYRAKERPGMHKAIAGIDQVDKAIVIDQTPIGRTPRSNPATYTGAFAPIREVFAGLPLSRIRGYNSGRFSFNVRGGRCENCQGDGMIRIEMHFLADVYVECEVCGGKRYNRETLEVTFKGKNIADVLDMSIDEASRFFRQVPAISDKLTALEQVGLGYLRLGQSGTTLSGGEAQRVKLATELAKRATGRTVYIMDEPTTGLHFADIEKLLEVLLRLRASGNTLIVIEHNLEVIKCADWVIDLGPEGGSGGGQIVAEGTPEQVARCDQSETGKYLRRYLG
ncbi:MAG TPA: excinuclease ABC subunit UvrA [Chthoniobacterales bacterium]